ncbi:MAG TPA: hypothetical protein VF077_12850 [Nitrospiraceae bacterium]
MNTLAGVDWKSIFQNIPAAATAQAIALAWTPILGSRPAVIPFADHYEIQFDPDQEDRAAAWIESQLDAEPGPVRMNLGGVAIKVIARQYWPWILGIAATGALVGYSMRGRR